MSPRQGVGVLIAMLLAGCGGPTPEEVVTSTAHCSAVTLTHDLMMRLSSYQDHPDSVEVWVVQACHPTGTACSPVMAYDHAPPPVYAVSGDEVTVELLGGNLRWRVDRVAIGQSRYALRAQTIHGYVDPEGVEAFRRRIRHRCPEPGRQYPG